MTSSPGPKLRASVVVLGYNGLHYMDGCISSVLDQDMPRDEYEVLYVDNASTDGSAASVREKFPDVTVVEFDRNHGFAAGNNLAVPYSSGEWIVFLNQDTVAARSWLRELIEAVDSSPQIMAGHSNIIHPWYPDFAGLECRAEARHAYTPDLMRWGYCRYRDLGPAGGPVDVLILSGAALALRRTVLPEVGYVFDDEFFAYGEDWDLGLRIRSLGHRCVLAPRSTVYHLYTPKTGLKWRNFAATVRNVRNRYLAFFKVMPWPQFLATAALLTIGAPFNAFEFGLKRRQQLLYSAALLPTTALAVLAAAWNLRRYSEKRRAVLDARVERPGWCLRSIWRGNLTPPPI